MKLTPESNVSESVRRLNPGLLGSYVPPSSAIPPAKPIIASAASERESDLRESIRQEIVKRRWVVFCGTTARATGRTLGEPDLLVFADHGRVFPVELKTRDGKLSPVQVAVHHHLRTLGHNPVVVRSFEEFLEIVK